MEQSKTDSRVMSIDYGEKRVGIALSDPLLTFAYAFSTLSNDSALLTNLTKIINDKNIVKIVLGLPSEKFKSSGKLVAKVLELKSAIEKKNKIK